QAAVRVRSLAHPHWKRMRDGKPGRAWLKAQAVTRKTFPGTMVFALAAAAAFYLSPWLILTAAGFLCLAIVVVLRPDIGVGLVLATAPFYLYPRRVFGKEFSTAEITLLLSCAGHMAHRIDRWLRDESRIQTGRNDANNFNGLDAAMIGLVLVGTISAVSARYTHVAFRELRLVIIEPALLYWIIRTSRLDREAVWSLVDMLVLGATVVALIGLIQFGLNVNIITAEQGFRRLRSVYGSPNNASLMLGRIIPMLMATVIWARHTQRRVGYALSLITVATATVLTFSKGALLLGIPLAVLALGFLASTPWSWIGVATLVIAGLCAIPLLSTPRFASLLDSTQGTTFFRLQIWRSSLAMFRSAPIFGVGPDNFLYSYRGRFILPAAWQEPNISQAHNVVLNFATRLGILGLAAAVWLQAGFWRRGLPLRFIKDPDNRALALGLMGMMAAYLGHGLVDSSHFVIDLAYVFSFTLGLVQWLSRSGAYGIEKQPN
ncbi:MAG: O-antigen ligase family protein, partial [Anaerolineae bacterium]|nr:O-antigen ligase family protein [Anaerolineae bacterium]